RYHCARRISPLRTATRHAGAVEPNIRMACGIGGERNPSRVVVSATGVKTTRRSSSTSGRTPEGRFNVAKPSSLGHVLYSGGGLYPKPKGVANKIVVRNAHRHAGANLIGLDVVEAQKFMHAHEFVPP